MAIVNPTLDELLSSPVGTKWSPNISRTTFTQEIQQMMYGFGDYERPLYESAQLVEHIVHQQLTAFLWQALDIARTRGSQCIGLEEILFLMRFDRQKLSRLVKHLSVKEGVSAIRQGIDSESILDTTNTSNDNTNGTSSEDVTPKPPQQTKHVKLCYDFLSSIDSTGALLVVFDDKFVDSVKHERNMRCDRIASSISESDYPAFCESRQSSFATKTGRPKFKDWLLKDSQLELKPNALALEVLQYLAKETVSQVVDLALLVKQDSERDVCDPLASLLPQKMINKDFPLNHSNTSQTNNESEDLLANHSSQSNPFFMSSQSKSVAMNALTNGTDGQKSRKRKKTDQSKLSFEAHSYCITPNHIREAVRRYFASSGPFAKSNHFSNHTMNHNKKLLCL